MTGNSQRKRRETQTGRLDFIEAARSCRRRNEPGNLIPAWYQVVRKYAFEPALFVLVMQQDYRSDSQRMPAGVACRHFSLQILQETIGKMILIGSAPRRFFPMRSAIRAGVLQSILLRI